MKNKFLFVSVLIFMTSSALAENNYIYRYKNKEGKIIYSDILPANEKGEFSVLSTKSGVIKKVVEKELTQDELEKKEEENIQTKKIVEDNNIQKKKDISLLSTYSNIDEIDKMRKYELDQIDLGIKNNIDNIAILKDRLNLLEENKKINPNSKTVQDDYEKTIQSLNMTQQILETNKKMYAQREKKYDDDKSRYLIILKEMATVKEK